MCVLRWILVVSKYDKTSCEYFYSFGLNTQGQLIWRVQQRSASKIDFGLSQDLISFYCATWTLAERCFLLFHFGRIVFPRRAPVHDPLSRHGITRSSSVLRMAYRKRCIFSTCCCSCFPMAAGCSEASQITLVVPFLGCSHPLNVNFGGWKHKNGGWKQKYFKKFFSDS